MSTREKLIQARVSMLALADELQSISRACKVAGISRSHFYDIKDAFEKYGREGLAPVARRRPRTPRREPVLHGPDDATPLQPAVPPVGNRPAGVAVWETRPSPPSLTGEP